MRRGSVGRVQDRGRVQDGRGAYVLNCEGEAYCSFLSG